MSDKLRDAIDRLRAMAEPDQQTWDLSMKDVAAIRTVLAEYPVDDAEPVTEEWLRAVGFTLMHGLTVAIPGSHANLTWFSDSPNWWIGNTPLTAQPTRGHVRRLCAALGIALKEPPSNLE